MATTTATKTRATGFAVPCPHCGAVDDGLKVQVKDLALTCQSCEEVVTKIDLERLIDDARRLVAWLDLAATV